MYRIRPPLPTLSATRAPLSLPLPARPRFYQQLPFNQGPRPQYKRFSSSSGGLSGLLYRWAARPTFYRDIGILSAGAGAFYLYNLEEVPVSGRRRFNIIPAELEEAIGRSSVDQVREQYAGRILPDNDMRVRKVKKVLQRLLPYAEGEGLQGLDWEVTVIESPEQNAFVAPGGKVFVFTGILPLCRDEDGIAAVLGHEIAHVVARHTAERMSQAPLVLIGVLALSLFDISFYSGKLLIDLFLSMPASRKHEAEADFIGLMMMAQGCYKPQAAMDFWARMEKMGNGEPPQILSTHPSHHNREEKIREWLPKALEKAEASECYSTSQYANQFSSAFSGLGGW
ncbi:hypothetical protein COCMIDRAFT_97039 [Bipolaris oryzae ATCC 44560]|uniref:Peptidase M48 domain-containing protein n=1 Tax=Bipolaris oryzae ATCC 44560 TaxID=930090 RepID=W6ZBP9_COCMI|nr:uncharacterized protein COCMIDRAFT_97039 [Bipolaris oryzae ATCC 44560]EUC44879.1 hypothetical protein COCMIDRAFT_97039 [Bipolaris oryzae ATCC 44560]